MVHHVECTLLSSIAKAPVYLVGPADGRRARLWAFVYRVDKPENVFIWKKKRNYNLGQKSSSTFQPRYLHFLIR